jgi:hypothetical protein
MTDACGWDVGHELEAMKRLDYLNSGYSFFVFSRCARRMSLVLHTVLGPSIELEGTMSIHTP